MVLWNIFATNLKVLNPARTGRWKPRLLFQIWVEGPGCPEIWHLMLEQSLAFLSRHNSLAIQCSTECCSESSPLPMYCTNKQQQCTSNAPNCTTQCARWALGIGALGTGHTGQCPVQGNVRFIRTTDLSHQPIPTPPIYLSLFFFWSRCYLQPFTGWVVWVVSTWIYVY